MDGFHIAINRIDDFATFCSLLRGEPPSGAVVGATNDQSFHFEINSIDDFATFCALLRGSTPDAGTLRSLASGLRSSTSDLKQADQANQPS